MANPRKLAVNALLRVEKDKAYSNITLNSVFRDSDVTSQEKAFATKLFYGVLDRKITLDYFLNKVMKKPIEKASDFTACVLRTGLYQIIYMDSVPQFSAVDEAVKLVKRSKESRNSGFVNAVLRNAIRNGFELPKGETAQELSIIYSCPIWIINEFVKDYGFEEARSILEESLKSAPLNIRVNNTKISADNLIKEFESLDIMAQKGNVDNCLVIGGTDIENNELYKKGYFHVQDEASQRVCGILSPKKGDRVLDICAAPGGKTFTMAQIMENEGEIISCDLYESRTRLIKNGAERLHLDIVKAKVNDATVFADFGEFDCVLCDVPCSGLGIIRRKPDIKYKKTEDFSLLEEIQEKILSNTARYVKKGGKLLYSTCTLRKAENEEIIKKFLDGNKEFKAEYQHTFIPHRDETDGFYCALLVRN